MYEDGVVDARLASGCYILALAVCFSSTGA